MRTRLKNRPIRTLGERNPLPPLAQVLLPVITIASPTHERLRFQTEKTYRRTIPTPRHDTARSPTLLYTTALPAFKNQFVTIPNRDMIHKNASNPTTTAHSLAFKKQCVCMPSWRLETPSTARPNIQCWTIALLQYYSMRVFIFQVCKHHANIIQL